MTGSMLSAGHVDVDRPILERGHGASASEPQLWQDPFPQSAVTDFDTGPADWD
jgi:hypothetical protein